MRSKLLFSILIVCLSLPIIRGLFTDGYFPMHDDTQVARTITMGKALRNGQFPVRWVSDLGYGYGYPIYNFYGPLPYYLGGFFYVLGISGLVATKIMMGIGMLGAGLTMFLLASWVSNRTVGLGAALLYSYFPYHAVQLYVRGAIGELWVLVFLPLIVLGIYRRSILIGALGIAGVVLSHTLLGFTTVCFCFFGLILYAIIRKVSPRRIVMLLMPVFVGLLLSSFFWLPAIFEMKYTTVSKQIGPSANVFDHFVCLKQLWYSEWGFGGSAKGCIDGLSFALGKIHLAVIIMGIANVFIVMKQKQKSHLAILSLLIISCSVFFMTEFSTIFWRIIPGFTYLQYPWRFLVYTNLGISLLFVTLFSLKISKKLQYISVFVVIAGILVLNTKLFSPQYSYSRSADLFESEEDIKFRVSKISDEYLPQEIDRPQDASQIIKEIIPHNESYQYKYIINKETYKKIEFISEQQQEIILNHTHFPGWKYWVNSVLQKDKFDNGRPIITIPDDFSTLEMKFTDTPIRILGNVISLVSVILLGYYYGKKTIS